MTVSEQELMKLVESGEIPALNAAHQLMKHFHKTRP